MPHSSAKTQRFSQALWVSVLLCALFSAALFLALTVLFSWIVWKNPTLQSQEALFAWLTLILSAGLGGISAMFICKKTPYIGTLGALGAFLLLLSISLFCGGKVISPLDCLLRGAVFLAIYFLSNVLGRSLSANRTRAANRSKIRRKRR